MRKRQTPLEIFSTFLKLPDRGNYGGTWVAHQGLRNNLNEIMVSEESEYRNYSTSIWSQYWLQEARQELPKSLATLHLSAYLEETCYYIATTTARRFTNIGDWRDCFQIVRAEVANPIKLLKNYDVVKGSGISTYGQMQLKSILMDKYVAGGARSEAGLLRSLTEKRLRDALKDEGISGMQLESHILGWYCFKEIYTPTKAKGGRQLEMPTEEQYVAISQRYNQLRNGQGIEPDVSSKQIQALLKRCVQAVRSEIKKVSSPLSLDDSESMPDLPASETTEFETIADQTREWQEINAVLANSFMALSTEAQIVLKLCYGMDLNQGDVAKVFGQEQYQISRQVQKWLAMLLESLMQWSAKNLEMMIAHEDIKQKTKQMQIWLAPYCQQPLHQFLLETFRQLPQADVDLVRLVYIQELDISSAAEKFGSSVNGVTVRLAQISLHLVESLQQHVETNWEINLKPIQSIDRKLGNLVKDWLEQWLYKAFR